MKTRHCNPMYCLLVCLIVTGSAMGQSRSEPAGHSGMQPDAPGAVHKQLSRLAGEYTTSIKFRMQPGAAPVESAGTARISLGLGGRFLVEENSGTLFGQPYSGMRLYGYNNGTKQYEAMWVYTESTAILNLTGASQDDGKTVTYTGAFAYPGGGKENLRVVVRQVDNNHFAVELYGNADGGGAGPVLETLYTRKGGQ